MGRPRIPAIEKFWRNVVEIDDHWIWIGGTRNPARGASYGALRDPEIGKTLAAHRFSYEQFIGPIPEGLNVCHSCDIPECVKPQHLFAGTDLDNVLDAVSKGRNSRGEKHGMSILKAEEVQEILRLRFELGMIYREIAVRFGVCIGTIFFICKGRHWKDVRTNYNQTTHRTRESNFAVSD